MFCRFCGAEVPEDTIFCNKCGKRVQKDGTSSDAGEAAKPVRKKPRSRGAVLAGLLILAVLAVVLVFVLSGRNREQSQQGNDADNDPMQQSPVSVDAVRFEQYNEKDAVVIEYTWTNLTDTEISAAESVAIHAYQNGIALESADSAAVGDLRQRKGKPGASVKLEDAFYLDDLTGEVLVEVTPQSTGSGIVYFRKTYSRTMASTEEPGVDIMDSNGDVVAPTVDDPASAATSSVPAGQP